jgi:hypothetical protein
MIAAVNSRPMTDQTFMTGFSRLNETDATPAPALQARHCLL